MSLSLRLITLAMLLGSAPAAAQADAGRDASLGVRGAGAGAGDVAPVGVVRITGQLVGGFGGAVVQAVAIGTEWRDSAAADSRGRFGLALPASVAAVGVRLSTSDSTYQPALVRSPAGSAQTEVGVVMVPTRWRIEVGRYAGQAVEIHPRDALVRSCLGCPRFLGSGEGGWPTGVLPLQVAFDREDSAERITASDSARFWAAVEELEADAGLDLFRPAAYREVSDDPENAVLVWADHTLARFAGWGSVGSDAHGRIRTAMVAFRSFSLIAGDEGGSTLVGHELVHALGFSHTCAWPSLMADSTRCPALRAERLTAEDVAYIQLSAAVGAAGQVVGASRPWDPTLAAASD